MMKMEDSLVVKILTILILIKRQNSAISHINIIIRTEIVVILKGNSVTNFVIPETMLQ